jgi:hypothetical protein
MTSLGIRLRGLLLAILFAAGNLGLPVADVLLDHGLGARHPDPRPHYETPGGCHDRSEHCILGRLLGELRLQSPATGAIRLAATHGSDAAVPAAPGLHSTSPAPANRSRAPPPPFV